MTLKQPLGKVFVHSKPTQEQLEVQKKQEQEKHIDQEQNEGKDVDQRALYPKNFLRQNVKPIKTKSALHTEFPIQTITGISGKKKKKKKRK